jgi:hypothetical protein
MDLPPLQMKRGGQGFDFDADILKDQNDQIAKMNKQKEEY